MRLCRFKEHGRAHVGFYDEQRIVPVAAAAAEYRNQTGGSLDLHDGTDLLAYLPPHGSHWRTAATLSAWLEGGAELPAGVALAQGAVPLLVPVPRPNKLLLLAGNYADHIREGGGVAAEREATFPYLFMKPPSTTLTHPGQAVVIPKVSPHAIDWELELAVIIGRECKAVPESEALAHVAGYTIVNDVSNRKFRPNPGRQKREKDAFFDWQHGKWFDSFCPCGPCVRSADSVPDPQRLHLQLTVNGELKQDFSTAQMVFPVAAVVSFVSGIVRLEPGDIICTGTGPGVGAASGVFLKPGDEMRATISTIGTLVSPVVAES